jgi:hypothetical protein
MGVYIRSMPVAYKSCWFASMVADHKLLQEGSNIVGLHPAYGTTCIQVKRRNEQNSMHACFVSLDGIVEL